MTTSHLIQRLLMSLMIALSMPCAEVQCVGQQPTQDQAAINKIDATLYNVLFRRASEYKRLSDEAVVRSQDKSYLRRILPNRLQLSSDDAARLERIAVDCQNDLAPLEEEAFVAVAKFREHFPQGKAVPGMDISPPPELSTLQDLEDSVVIRYRDLLKSEMKQEDFQRTDENVRQMFGGGFSTAQPSSLHTAAGSR